MIIALLVLIVFILLFGAAAVKGWLKSTATMILGFVILVGLVLWLGSFFGGDGPMYVILGGGGLLLVLAMWVKSTEPIGSNDVKPPASKSRPTFHSRAPSREERKRLREQHPDRSREG